MQKTAMQPNQSKPERQPFSSFCLLVEKKAGRALGFAFRKAFSEPRLKRFFRPILGRKDAALLVKRIDPDKRDLAASHRDLLFTMVAEIAGRKNPGNYLWDRIAISEWSVQKGFGEGEYGRPYEYPIYARGIHLRRYVVEVIPIMINKTKTQDPFKWKYELGGWQSALTKKLDDGMEKHGRFFHSERMGDRILQQLKESETESEFSAKPV